MPSARQIRYERWLAAGVTIACASIYLALRPPIYDGDGYLDLIYAVGANRLDAVDPTHLLSIPIEIAMISVSGAHPYAPTIPFQVLGISLTCFALFYFCLLLMRIGASALVAATACVFVAMSPRVWYVAFQNKPYPQTAFTKSAVQPRLSSPDLFSG